MLTVWPVAMLVVPVKFRSAPDVPTAPSTRAVPPEVVRRYQVAAVPEPAPAVPVPFAIAPTVSTPADAAPNVAAHVWVESATCDVTAVSGDAGCVPLYKVRIADAPAAVLIAACCEVFNAAEYFRFDAIQAPEMKMPALSGQRVLYAGRLFFDVSQLDRLSAERVSAVAEELNSPIGNERMANLGNVELSPGDKYAWTDRWAIYVLIESPNWMTGTSDIDHMQRFAARAFEEH
jgi:hypothetical protein